MPIPPGPVDTRTNEQRTLDEMRSAFHGVPYGLLVRAAGGLAVGAVMAFLLYIQVKKHMGPQDQLASVLVVSIAGLAIGFGFFRLGVQPPNVYKVAHLLSRCRLCLCCGYDLSASIPANDGCTVCPECGAAWQLGLRQDLTESAEAQTVTPPPDESTPEDSRRDT
jgi:tetrahydromethanopterin S-methyltransferase subunit F